MKESVFNRGQRTFTPPEERKRFRLYTVQIRITFGMGMLFVKTIFSVRTLQACSRSEMNGQVQDLDKSNEF